MALDLELRAVSAAFGSGEFDAAIDRLCDAVVVAGVNPDTACELTADALREALEAVVIERHAAGPLLTDC